MAWMQGLGRIGLASALIACTGESGDSEQTDGTGTTGTTRPTTQETSGPLDSSDGEGTKEAGTDAPSGAEGEPSSDDDSESGQDRSDTEMQEMGDVEVEGGESGEEEEPEKLEPCPVGSVIEIVSTGEYYSRPGVVFASEMIIGQGENHQPKKLEVRVMKDGMPVEACEVGWRAEVGNGWGFGASSHTNSGGNLYGYWTAGQPGENRIEAYIELEDGSSNAVEFQGTVSDSSSRTDSVHLNHEVDGSYDEYKIRITPRSGPVATYYSALNWRDSYAGIQFVADGQSMVIFSVWDAGGEKAQILDQGVANECTGFGGEGTGTSCRFRLPGAIHGAVPGLPDDYELEVGNTYELHLTMKAGSSGGTEHSITFSDVTNGIGPLSLGTQWTGRSFSGGGFASSFVEEWTSHGNCLSNARRVEYHDMQAKVDGEWVEVKRASFSPNYVPTNNEICANYLAEIRDGRFFVSSGGSDDVGRPYVENDPNFPKPQATMEVE